jgi:hypothetical protein
MIETDIECKHDLDGFALVIATKEQVGFRFIDNKVLTLPGGERINRARWEGPTLAPPPLPLVFGPRPPFAHGKKPDWEGEICVSGQRMSVAAFRSTS